MLRYLIWSIGPLWSGDTNERVVINNAGRFKQFFHINKLTTTTPLKHNRRTDNEGNIYIHARDRYLNHVNFHRSLLRNLIWYKIKLRVFTRFFKLRSVTFGRPYI